MSAFFSWVKKRSGLLSTVKIRPSNLRTLFTKGTFRCSPGLKSGSTTSPNFRSTPRWVSRITYRLLESTTTMMATNTPTKDCLVMISALPFSQRPHPDHGVIAPSPDPRSLAYRAHLQLLCRLYFAADQRSAPSYRAANTAHCYRHRRPP